MPHRRAFLATMITLTSLPDLAKAADRKRIVVVGAGLSGLASARQCVDAGHDVIVLEARDRVGGRIWTSEAWPGLPMDLGASWIHGTKGNPLSKIADAAGLRRVGTKYGSAMALGQGDDPERAIERATDVVEAIRDSGDSAGGLTLRDVITQDRRWLKATPEMRRMIRHAVNGSYEQEYGADWAEASAQLIDAAKEFGGGDVLFPAGFIGIINFLGRGLDVRTGVPVLSLNRTSAGQIRVSTATGDEMADHVIVTVPLGVLQQRPNLFGAPLAAERQTAIRQLGMGLLNKCWLRFERIAWPKDVDWIEWVGPRDGYWTQWVSLAQRLNEPVLLAFHAGAQARAMEKLDDQAMIEEAHAALRQMFGSAFPKPVAAQVTRWGQDPFTLGSYSFNKAGMNADARQHLAGMDWDGTISFAGEAASPDYFGTAHGAYLSGVAAGRNVVRHL